MFKKVLREIKKHGFEAYLVGGSVRDMILNRKVYDYDICTSALPEQTKQIFKDYTVLETGIKHGTVTLIYQGTHYEITAFRSEKGYSDFRHPDSVEFISDLTTDLTRRDFTMNAVCFDGESFTDPLNGIKDIEAGIIRAVGHPEKRFEEDAMRILRGIRFASVLGFRIEAQTEKAMFKYKENINTVSAERIFSEIKKMTCGNYFGQAYKKYYEIFASFIPEAKNTDCIFDSEADAISALKRLKADKQSILYAKAYFGSKSLTIPYLLRFYGDDAADFVCKKRGLTKEYEAVISQKMPYKLSMLEINGNDIKKICKNDKNISTVLNLLLTSVMEGKTENKHESLVEKAVDILRYF